MCHQEVHKDVLYLLSNFYALHVNYYLLKFAASGGDGVAGVVWGGGSKNEIEKNILNFDMF